MSRIRKPSPALLVAVVALVAALCGGAVAGVAVHALNKKEKKQVKRISKRQAHKLDKRIELLPGPRGPQGAPGPQGDPGATTVVVRSADSDPGTLAGTSETATAHCNPGEVAVGGGATPLNILNSNMTYIKSNPSPFADGAEPTAWTATLATDTADGNGFIETYAVCASP